MENSNVKLSQLSHERMKKEYAGGNWFAHFKNSDQRAFSYFFTEYFSRMVGYATRKVGQETVAEEIVSKCLLLIMGKAAAFKSIDDLEKYTYTAVRHGCIDHLRAITYRKKVLNENNYPSEETENDYDEEREYTERTERMYRGMEDLPTESKQILHLTLLGKSDSEIAAELNIKKNTVAQKRKRALAYLRTSLNPRRGK